VFLTLFHGVGLHWILVGQRRGERSLRSGRPYVVAASALFAWSVFLMLDLHLVEIVIWAFALNHMGLIEHAYDAIYFCANDYTTLGMGKMDVDSHWHIISPIIGISGLFTFAWTTSALVDVVAANRQLLGALEEEREREMHMRFALRKKEWEALKTERDAERVEKAKTAPAGATLMQRFRMWREERKFVAELRREKMAEIKKLRRQERLEETKPGDGAAGGDPGDNPQE
jgi:hypothetical protein